jgi:hypothetical protein
MREKDKALAALQLSCATLKQRMQAMDSEVQVPSLLRACTHLIRLGCRIFTIYD